jgi:hypothetical protein
VANLLTSLNELPLVVKIGWMLWMAWGTAQVLWFRRAHVMVPVATVSAPAPAAPARRRSVPARPAASMEADVIIGPANASGSVLGLS